MNCKCVRARLSAYIDGELPGRDMLDMRSHVSRCRECEQEEREVRAFKRMLGAMRPIDPPEGFEERLLRAVRTRQPQFQVFRKLRFAPYAVVLAAAATFATVVMVRPKEQPTENVATQAGPNFELTRDQAYVAGSDPLGVGPVAVPATYARR